jgi:hypothetical protein
MGVTRANAKETAKEAWFTLTGTATSSPLQCLTLEEDESTRCSRLATKGDPKPDRCDIHHGQYCILQKKYNIASGVVDYMKHCVGLPIMEQIGQCSDWKAALKEARRVRHYLEAIRVERTGRDIHQRRFFLEGECECPALGLY